MKLFVSKNIQIAGILSLIVLTAAGCIKRSTDDSANVPAHIQQQQTPPPAALVPPPSQVSQKITPPPPAKPTASGTVMYAGVEGKTALELLRASHTITTKSFSGLGEYVESIDGVKPDSKHFWSFYVNGKSSNVGASSYTTKSGDVIEWKLEVIN